MSKSYKLALKIEQLENEIQNFNLEVAECYSSWDFAPTEVVELKEFFLRNLVILKRKYFRMIGLDPKVIAG